MAGAGQMDTTLAVLPQALVVEVRGPSGAPSSGDLVRFAVLAPVDSALRAGQGAYLCDLAAAPCLPYASARTDTSGRDGRASVVVRLGTAAGTVRVGVSVPALGFTDTVSFTVRPGSAARLGLRVRDSSAYAGSGYPVGAVATDAHGNPRAGDAVTFAELDPTVATIDSAGAWRAVALGRAGAVVRSGALSDTAWITVPPRGTLAVFDVGVAPSRPTGVAKVELDGSAYRLLARTGDTYEGAMPDWGPSGTVAYEATAGAAGQRIFVVDTLGGVPRRITPDGAPTSGELFGAFGRDGTLFFSAWGGVGDYGTAVWQSAGAGAAPVRVGPTPHANANAWKPTPAPDGRRVAYIDVNRGGLHLLDVATGGFAPVLAGGDMPRWSPAGDWILFSDQRLLYRVRPDGTGRTRIGVGPYGALHETVRADWSPDGEWVVVRAAPRLALVHVASGRTVPLPPWSATLLRPAWRR